VQRGLSGQTCSINSAAMRDKNDMAKY